MEHFLEVWEGDVESSALTEGMRHTFPVTNDINKTIVAPRLYGGHGQFHPMGVLAVAGVSSRLSHENDALGVREQRVGVGRERQQFRQPAARLTHVLLDLVGSELVVMWAMMLVDEARVQDVNKTCINGNLMH